MMPAALSFEVFNDRLAGLNTAAPDVKLLLADVSLGVGFLLGAGLPGAAAAFAHLAERAGEADAWPWKGYI